MIKDLRMKYDENDNIIYDFEIVNHGLWDNIYRLVINGKGDNYRKNIFKYGGVIDEEDRSGDPEDDIIWFLEPDGIEYENGKLKYGDIFTDPVILDLVDIGLLTEKEVTDTQEYIKETGCRSYDIKWYLKHTDTIKEDSESHFTCNFKWLGKTYNSEFVDNDVMIRDEDANLIYLNKGIISTMDEKKYKFMEEIFHFVKTR